MTVILIVDDSPVDRLLIGEHVARSGATPSYASNGEEALEIIERDRPDCILTDLQMPKLDGLELVKRVRRDFTSIPVILMTGFGSEDIAVKALQLGAASYVAKRHLRADLSEALRTVLDAAAAVHERTQVRRILRRAELEFELDYEPGAVRALVGFLQNDLTSIAFCDDTELIRIGTALTEALANAVDHGNLELDSKLRELPGDAYRELGAERSRLAPYRDRRVHVRATVTPAEATYVIRDEGPGFDMSQIPDPTDPENLALPHGRGVMLINCFMDDVRYNAAGNEVTMVKRFGSKPSDDDDDEAGND